MTAAYEWSPGGCCCDVSSPGFMDLYTVTQVVGRKSSTGVFSRVCNNNVTAAANNGYQVESLWGAERDAPDQHREIIQSVATWNGFVYQLEKCRPVFVDEFPVDVYNFNDLVGRHPDTDPSSIGWTVVSTVAPAIAVFDIQRANYNGVTDITFSDANLMQQGIVFRYVDANNYWRVVCKQTSVVLEKVVAGVVTTVQTQTVLFSFWFGGSIIVNLTLNGSSISCTVSSVSSTTVSTTDSTFLSSTKAGLYEGVVSSARKFSGVRYQGLNTESKYYISVYNTAGPAVLAENQNSAYNSTNSLAAGTSALWFPRTYNVAVTAASWTSFPPGESSGGNPGIFPTVHTIDNAGVVTVRANYTYPMISGVYAQDTAGNYILSSVSEQALGRKAAGVPAKHGYPISAGLVIRSTEIYSIQFGTTYYVRGECALIAGELTFPGGNVAPHVNEQTVIATWTSTVVLSNFPRTPTEDDRRYRVGSMISLSGAGGFTAQVYQQRVHFFDATPDLSNYFVHISHQPVNSFFISAGGNKVTVVNTPTGTYQALVAPGYVMHFWNGHIKIYGSSGLVYDYTYAGDGLSGPPILRCASDRFFYLENFSFPNVAAYEAFVTGTPPAVGSSSCWMISLDGSIRIPCYAVHTNGTYMDRRTAEQLGGSIGYSSSRDFDCVKNSTAIPYCPPVEFPTF